jgi:flagellar basal body-associated protein FliL
MTWLLILLIVLFALALVGGGGYVYRSYSSGPAPAGGTVVEESGTAGNPVGAVVALFLVLLVILFLIYGGYNLFHWFGNGVNVNVNVHS